MWQELFVWFGRKSVAKRVRYGIIALPNKKLLVCLRGKKVLPGEGAPGQVEMLQHRVAAWSRAAFLVGEMSLHHRER